MAVTIIAPDSWNALDWSHPSGLDSNYWLSIDSALAERWSACGRAGWEPLPIPFRIPSEDVCRRTVESLAALAPNFWEEGEPGTTPRRLSWSGLVAADPRLSLRPCGGSVGAFGGFLQAVRGALDRMQLSTNLRLVGAVRSRDGYRGGASSAEAVGAAVGAAMGTLSVQEWDTRQSGETAFTAESWTASERVGPAEWRGTARSKEWRVDRSPRALKGRAYNLYVAAEISPPLPLGEGDRVEFSAPDGMAAGVSVLRLAGAGNVSASLGAVDWLPAFGADHHEGTRILKGFRAVYSVFIDYRVDGGWRFF